MKIITMFIIIFIMNWPALALVRLIVEFSSDEVTQSASHRCVVFVLLMF